MIEVNSTREFVKWFIRYHDDQNKRMFEGPQMSVIINHRHCFFRKKRLRFYNALKHFEFYYL